MLTATDWERSSSRTAPKAISRRQSIGTEFQIDFCRELTRLKKWAADRHWPGLPTPEFHVVVSDRYRISKSLVPAWSGRTGHMEFPTWRVIARKAAIAHELVHVFFPNGNRLLAEGLAVYLQAEIGSNPAFPNFGRPLHELVRERLRDMVPGFSTRRPRQSRTAPSCRTRRDRDAKSADAQRSGTISTARSRADRRIIYPIAGSFVQHLIESRGLESFRALYERTPLVPLHQDCRIARTLDRSLWGAAFRDSKANGNR